jgi:hypothetical protein
MPSSPTKRTLLGNENISGVNRPPARLLRSPQQKHATKAKKATRLQSLQHHRRILPSASRKYPTKLPSIEKSQTLSRNPTRHHPCVLLLRPKTNDLYHALYDYSSYGTQKSRFGSHSHLHLGRCLCLQKKREGFRYTPTRLLSSVLRNSSYCYWHLVFFIYFDFQGYIVTGGIRTKRT